MDRARPAPRRARRCAAPSRSTADRVVVLFDTRVAVLDPTRDTWTTLIDAEAAGVGRFGTLVRGFSGELWIAAAGGLGRLDGAALRALDAVPRRPPRPTSCPRSRATAASCSPPRSTDGRGARSPSGSPPATSSACSSRPRRCARGAARTARSGCSKARAPGAWAARSRRRWPGTVRCRAWSTTSSPSPAAPSGSPRRPASGATPRRSGGRRIR